MTTHKLNILSKDPLILFSILHILLKCIKKILQLYKISEFLKIVI